MKTLTIDNKHYQECDVVMLPTDKADYTSLIKNDDKANVKGLFWNQNRDKNSYFTQEYLNSVPAKAFHLYVLSNDEIKEGDWFYDEEEPEILKAGKNVDLHLVNNLKPNFKKIIATTDSFLTIKVKSRFLTDGITIHKQLYKQVALPQIPQYFIEHFINEYNKGNVISKVLVEVEREFVDGYTEDRMRRFYGPVKIKLNQSNEISIVTKEKEVFHREEVISLIEQALTFKPTRELGSLVTAQREIWRPNFRTWIEQHVK
jgi:hypothetical protein